MRFAIARCGVLNYVLCSLSEFAKHQIQSSYKVTRVRVGAHMASKYAVLIASGQFSDRNLPRLSAPLDDVTSFREVLTEPSIGGFPKENVSILYDTTLPRARTAVEQLFRSKNNDDLILLYYTGHGLVDEDGELYFALDGTELSSLGATSLDADYIRKQMNRCASKRMVVILDCCHSGAFVARGGMAAKGIASPAITRSTFETSGHGSYILTSSTSTQQSFEKDGQSIFTRYLVEGLRSGKAAPRKSNITIRDLEQYINTRLHDSGMRMRTTLISYTEGDPLIIAGNPNKSEPIDQRIIDGLSSKEPKDLISQLGAISFLGFQFGKLSGSEADEAKGILDAIGGDEERLPLVRRAAQSALGRTSPSKAKSLPVWAMVVIAALAVAFGGFGGRLIGLATPPMTLEDAKKILAAEWKRDPDAVWKDANELPGMLSAQVTLNARLQDADSKIEAAQKALPEPPSLTVAKRIVGAEWKRDPDAVRKDADELPGVLSAQTALNARLQDTESKLQVAEKALDEPPSLAAAKKIVGAEWKRDPDAVKYDADQLPQVVRQLTQLQNDTSDKTTSNYLVVVDNYDIRGENLNGARGDSITLEKCASTCGNTSKCVGYTYDKWNHVCFLKSSTIALTFEPKATSAIRNSLALPQSSPLAFKINRFRNKAFPGNAYNKDVVSSYADCENNCIDDIRCVAINFERAANSCNYFNSVGEYFTNDTMDAGAKEPTSTVP